MANLLPRGGPHFTEQVHELLAKVSDKRLAAASLALSKMFSGRMSLSTLFDGPRQEVLAPEEAADLRDLTAALPENSLSRDVLIRDRFASEPRMLAWLRQIEGHRPQALAVLTPDNREAADEAVGEARAMGYSLMPGERQIALKAPGTAEILDKQLGHITFGTGCDWDTVDQIAVTAGLNAFPALKSIFDSPLAAAIAGLFGPVRETRRFGQHWQCQVTLPPLSRTTSEHSWVFSSPDSADLALVAMVRELDPLLAETFPGSDGHILATAKLAPGHKMLEEESTTGLRLILSGPEEIRRATAKLAEKIARLHGGRAHWPKGLPARADLEAVLAACGAARLERAANLDLPSPPDAKIVPVARAIRGDIVRFEVVTYLRDLARSLSEAQQALGLVEDQVRSEAPNLTSHQNDTARAHG